MAEKIPEHVAKHDSGITQQVTMSTGVAQHSTIPTTGRILSSSWNLLRDQGPGSQPGRFGKICTSIH